MHFFKFQRIFILPLAIFFLFGFMAYPEKETEKSFKVNEGGTLHIKSDLGSVEVNSSSDKNVRLKITPQNDMVSEDEFMKSLEDFEITFTQNGDEIFMEIDYLKEDWNRDNLTLKILATVPRKFNLDLATAGGSITVDNLDGELMARTAGGSLKFGNIKGAVKGKTAGGSISLAGSNGTVEVKTAGGSINLGNVDGDVTAKTAGGSIQIASAGGNVVASTAGGSISVNEIKGNIQAETAGGSITAYITEQPKGECSLKTTAGSVVVYLAENVGVDVDAKTSLGKIDTDLPITVQGVIADNELKGQINGGGPLMVLRATAGKIKLSKK